MAHEKVAKIKMSPHSASDTGHESLEEGEIISPRENDTAAHEKEGITSSKDRSITTRDDMLSSSPKHDASGNTGTTKSRHITPSNPSVVKHEGLDYNTHRDKDRSSPTTQSKKRRRSRSPSDADSRETKQKFARGVEICVKSLPLFTTSAALEAAFRACASCHGKVKAHVPLDRITNEPKDYGWVTFESPRLADLARVAYDNGEISVGSTQPCRRQNDTLKDPKEWRRPTLQELINQGDTNLGQSIDKLFDFKDSTPKKYQELLANMVKSTIYSLDVDFKEIKKLKDEFALPNDLIGDFPLNEANSSKFLRRRNLFDRMSFLSMSMQRMHSINQFVPTYPSLPKFQNAIDKPRIARNIAVHESVLEPENKKSYEKIHQFLYNERGLATLVGAYTEKKNEWIEQFSVKFE